MKLVDILFLRTGLFINGILFCSTLFAQYAPPTGQPGTTAMYKDSSAFIGWASSCTVERGYVNIADTTKIFSGSNRTTYGNNFRATGPADEMVVSLGDHGSALLEFDLPIVDRSGAILFPISHFLIQIFFPFFSSFKK